MPFHNQFGLLGVGCASAAVALYEGVRISEIVLRPLPRMVSVPLAGALCGAIAYKFPQVNVGSGRRESLQNIESLVNSPLPISCLLLSPKVQYGYVNLEEIFRDTTHLSVTSIFSLLAAKIAATSVSYMLRLWIQTAIFVF